MNSGSRVNAKKDDVISCVVSVLEQSIQKGTWCKRVLNGSVILTSMKGQKRLSMTSLHCRISEKEDKTKKSKARQNKAGRDKTM